MLSLQLLLYRADFAEGLGYAFQRSDGPRWPPDRHCDRTGGAEGSMFYDDPGDGTESSFAAKSDSRLASKSLILRG